MDIVRCRGGRYTEMLRALGPGAEWLRFGTDVLVAGKPQALETALVHGARAGVRTELTSRDVDPRTLHVVVQKGRLFQQVFPEVSVIADYGRFLLVSMPPAQARKAGTPSNPCFAVSPVKGNTIVFESRRAAARAASVPWIQNLVDGLDQSSYEAKLTHLVSFPTRHSTSTHYASAATWARDELANLGYDARLETIDVTGAQSVNVLADKSGVGPVPRGLVLVVGHLDSVNTLGGPTAPAPGADDNGSGAAGVLAVAQALKDHPGNADLRLVLFGGEEQGLHGSTQFVSALPAAERGRLSAVINMDMIGTLNTAAPTVLLEGAQVSQAVMNDLADAAATYTGLAVQTSLNPSASDHVPFINAGLPAVLTIEGADSANGDIHSADDDIDRIDFGLALEILRMNVATAAAALGTQGDIIMADIIHTPLPAGPLDLDAESVFDINPMLRRQLSGTYVHNGGASARQAAFTDRAGDTVGSTTLNEASAPLDGPVFLPRPIPSPEPPPGPWPQPLPRPIPLPRSFDPPAESPVLRIRFTVRIDIDGPDPLNVVSGSVAASFTTINPTAHFVGRVASLSVASGTTNLVVEDFQFIWPLGGTIERLEIEIFQLSILGTPNARITFIEPGGRRHGPFAVPQASRYFHELEYEMDREDNAVDAEPYDTHTHPDRPSDLPREILTVRTAYAKAGLNMVRSSGSGTVVDTTEAGSDNRWSETELHQAMESHWSAFANRPQWKLWVFLAELGASDGLGGVMFDAAIGEPGGVDRQGTVVFTRAPHFHTETGAYIQANPPTAEAVPRELFFNLIHESGHAFNLYHSHHKSFATPWTAPAWMPVVQEASALSWMSYPEVASAAGATAPPPQNNATWFYERFRFRFTNEDLLFLRHAPERFVQMGAEAWGQHHGRVERETLNHNLELVVRNLTPVVDLGVPVRIEIRLKNVGAEPMTVHTALEPEDGYVEIAVTGPDGKRRPYLPVSTRRTYVERRTLKPKEAVYEAVNLTMGLAGFSFKRPGAYRIEASYTNLDGTTAAAAMRLYVRPPRDFEDTPAIDDLFHARVGRVLRFDGAPLMDDVNDRLDWALKRLGKKHPARPMLAAARNLPWARRFKTVPPGEGRLRVLDADPGRVEAALAPVLDDAAAAADTFGHITYRRMVDTYCDCALEAGKKAKAQGAQKALHGLFKKRKVVAGVIADVEKRLRKLK